MYKEIDGEVKAQIFDGDNLPSDWFESPEAAQAKPKKPKIKKEEK